MNVRATAVLTSIAFATAAATTVLAQPENRMQFAGKPRLLECDGQPCFRMDVNAVDAQGRPVSLDAASKFVVTESGRQLTIIRTEPLGGGTGTSETLPQTPRITLVLFDSSGSMADQLPSGQTKFDAARGQLRLLFDAFRDNLDQMAIAPFDSQRVAARIRGVQFQTTRNGLQRQVDALRVTPKGNTALYSATEEALQLLRTRTGNNAQISLVIFTDGKNDVGHPDDDPGLMGPDGLTRVIALAQQVGVPVYTVGYGATGVAFDEPAMQALAYPPPPRAQNYFSASDETRLRQAFENIVQRGTLAVRLLVGPVEKRRELLSGRSLSFHVTAGALGGDSPTWEGAPLIAPPIEGSLTQEEAQAVVRQRLAGDGGPPVSSALIRMAVLLTYSLVLAVFWLGVPRLIWPERYIPKPTLRRQSKTSETQSGARRQGETGAAASGYGGGRRRMSQDAPSPQGPRRANDQTVYIPPVKKPGDH